MESKFDLSEFLTSEEEALHRLTNTLWIKVVVDEEQTVHIVLYDRVTPKRLIGTYKATMDVMSRLRALGMAQDFIRCSLESGRREVWTTKQTLGAMGILTTGCTESDKSNKT